MLAQARRNKLGQKTAGVRNIPQLLGGGYDLHPGCLHGLAKSEPIHHVAGAARNVIDHHGVKFAALCSPQKGLEVFAVGVGTCFRLVTIPGAYLDIVVMAVFGDGLHLVGNAVFGLLIGGVTCVGCGFHF